MRLYICGLPEGEADFDPFLNPDGLRDELPEGPHYLDLACQLLEWIHPRKGARLRHLLDHELLEDASSFRLIPLVTLGEVVNLLLDIEGEVSAVADDNGHLRPGSAAALADASELLETYQDGEGRTIHSLQRTLDGVLLLRRFLISALVRALDVALD